MSLFDVNNKNVLITGASGGLGKHIATLFAQKGADVIICARSADKLEHLKASLEQDFDINVYSFVLDVNDRHAFKQMINSLEGSGISIDVLINNAGVSDTKSFLNYDDDDWDKIVNTNLKAPWQCSQEIAQHMISSDNKGSIINVTSILSESVNLGVSPYCTSKAGLRHLTQVMAVELARFGINVNAVAPGYMITDINKEYLLSDSGQQLLKRIPSRKFVDFEELNGVLLLLASQAGKGITGVEVKVDGGHSCTPI